MTSRLWLLGMLGRAPAGCARIRPLARFGRIARGRTELGVIRSLLMDACERRSKMFLVVVITHKSVRRVIKMIEQSKKN